MLKKVPLKKGLQFKISSGVFRRAATLFIDTPFWRAPSFKQQGKSKQWLNLYAFTPILSKMLTCQSMKTGQLELATILDMVGMSLENSNSFINTLKMSYNLIRASISYFLDYPSLPNPDFWKNCEMSDEVLKFNNSHYLGNIK